MFKLGPLWVIWIKIKEAYGIEQETGNGRDKEYPGGSRIYRRHWDKGNVWWRANGWERGIKEDKRGEVLNNPVRCSHTAINVKPEGKPSPFWCKTKPGQMRVSAVHKWQPANGFAKSKVLRESWVRYLDGQKEYQAQATEGKIWGGVCFLLLLFWFVVFGCCFS